MINRAKLDSTRTLKVHYTWLKGPKLKTNLPSGKNSHAENPNFSPLSQNPKRAKTIKTETGTRFSPQDIFQKGLRAVTKAILRNILGPVPLSRSTNIRTNICHLRKY